MKKIKNNEKVKWIIMKPTACIKCEIGQDWYLSEFEISFAVNECYPDYIEIQNWIMENIDGQELNIEKANILIYEMLKNEYDPDYLQIKNRVKGNKVHFDVEVITEEN